MNDSYFEYVGNGLYCYANSMAMLLVGIGEDIKPALIEVLTGISLGVKLNKEDNLLRFNIHQLLPDLGLTKALTLLGFTYETKVFEDKDDFPKDELKEDLKLSPAVIGPLDMGYLTYNPRHKYLKGADHYVLGYKIENDLLYLHDPENFPNVFLSMYKLKEAWQANGISYKKGYYRYITNLRRTEKPREEQIYRKAVRFFKENYLISEEFQESSKFELGSDALVKYSKYVKENGLNENDVKWYIYFALPLGAKRANDYAVYFRNFDQKLSELKFVQSQIFGSLHCYAVAGNWKKLAVGFEKLARNENEFKEWVVKNY
ncbi:MAG: hypothetical protein ABIE03_03100 [Patescibacteria group bacterium]|nr:hypothetical protein [Patescibacteria group bacterium]